MAEEALSVEDRINGLLLEEDREAGLEPEAPEQPQKKQPVAEEAEKETEQPEEKAATEEETPNAEPEAEERTISSLQELAEELGVEVADLYKLQIPVNTPDGRKEITLGEWKDSIQAAETVKAQQAKLSEQLEQRQALIDEWGQKMQESLAQTSSVLQMAEQELVRDYQSVNWQELRQYDPAEFAAKQQEFSQRQAQINQAKQVGLQQWQDSQRQRAEMVQKMMPEQMQLLGKLIPEWADSGTAEVEKPKVAKFLAALGYKQEEIANLYDARAVAVAYKAMKYDELKASKPASKKVLKIGSRPIKPGKSQSKAEQAEAVTRDQRMRLKKTGSVNDLAALLNNDEFLGDM